MSRQDDIARDVEAVKRAADAQQFPAARGFGTGGFDMPGDCSCPDLATLDPSCPQHGGKGESDGTLDRVMSAAERADRDRPEHTYFDGSTPADHAGHGCSADPLKHEEPISHVRQDEVCPLCRGVGGHVEDCLAVKPEETLADRVASPVVRHPDGQVEGLKEWATGEVTPDDWCPNDDHSAMCRCHLGGAILVDIPPAVGLSQRQQHVRARREASARAALDREAEELLGRAKHAAPTSTGAHARSICEEAADLVNGDRNADYGDALDNFTETGALWAVVFGHPVSAEQVALCLDLVKTARLIHHLDHADSWVDKVGYSSLGGGIVKRRADLDN
ncbi:hypothetical protein PBI_INDLOVU_54 [Mycobacterium phage Indlovu]|nr:hypothetical protein PBI_INDLOVU_54 [Mycobacterium phage Indlovu]